MNHPSYSLDNYFTEGKPCLSFNIEELNHRPPYDDSVMHRHDYYEIYLFEKIEGEHKIEFESYQLKSESVSVLFPRQFHNISIAPDSKGLVIMFTEEMFCSEMLRQELRAYFMDLQFKLNNLKLDAGQYKEISFLVGMIHDLFKDLNIIRKEQIRHIIKVILLKLMDISKFSILTKRESTEANEFLEFLNMVDNQYKDVRFVADYSTALDMSSKKLNVLSKKYRGQTALQVVHDRIFLEAKRLLAFSGLTHKEITYDLKFDSPSAFNKFIHSKSGYSPSDLQTRLTHIYKKEA